MTPYPLHVNLEGKRCVVVGGGKVAERKIETLRKHEAVIRLIAPQATPSLRALAESGALTWMRNLYHAGHLEDAFLVIAATDARDINATVARDAQERNLLVCCADGFADGNFTTPAQVTRGELVLTVSTGGSSPTLAAVLRERLEERFTPEWAALTALLGRLRPRLQMLMDENARRAAVRRLLDDPEVWAALVQDDQSAAQARAEALLADAHGTDDRAADIA